MREIVLDTETTGINPRDGHRIIEIGALELMHHLPTGKELHIYINPEREIDDGAVAVHGLTSSFLSDKPVFAEIVDEFLSFIGWSFPSFVLLGVVFLADALLGRRMDAPALEQIGLRQHVAIAWEEPGRAVLPADRLVVHELLLVHEAEHALQPPSVPRLAAGDSV